MVRRTALLVMPVLIAVLLLALTATAVAHAVPVQPEVWVCPSGDCEHIGHSFNSIQGGLVAVQPGGTVHVAAGTYTGPVVIDKDVTIQGAGPDATFVQGASRVFDVVSATVVLDNLAVTGGSEPAGCGGGIYVNEFATLTLSSSLVFDNVAMNGGGICNEGLLFLTDSQIISNTANVDYGAGGGILNYGTASITGSDIVSNTAGMFGGGFANAGVCTITHSSL
jgi:nitrous oxidase accessory protein NosD